MESIQQYSDIVDSPCFCTISTEHAVSTILQELACPAVTK